MVELQISFKSRVAGSFGSKGAAPVLEWATQTWARFTCVLLSTIIILSIAFSNIPANEKLPMIFFSPLIAITAWYAFLFLLLISRYLGLFGKIYANVLVIYFYLFSRIIVQAPPKVWLPLA